MIKIRILETGILNKNDNKYTKEIIEKTEEDEEIKDDTDERTRNIDSTERK